MAILQRNLIFKIKHRKNPMENYVKKSVKSTLQNKMNCDEICIRS